MTNDTSLVSAFSNMGTTGILNVSSFEFTIQSVINFRTSPLILTLLFIFMVRETESHVT